jgi:flagellar basal body-associated protein FliL
MWEFTNNKRSNILWILCLMVMTVAVIAMFLA